MQCLENLQITQDQTLRALVSMLKVHESKKKRKTLKKDDLSGRDTSRKSLLPKKNMV